MQLKKFTQRVLINLIVFIILFSIYPVYSMASYATLRLGSKGNAVTTMQQALVSLGYNTNGIDGIYGQGTLKAVKEFQKKSKLVVDGIAGNLTLTALYKNGSAQEEKPSTSTGNTNNSVINSTLRLGSKGNEVKLLQEKLNQLGYSVGAADGIFGNNTKKAVISFQKANKLKADGIVGVSTLAKLNGQNNQGSNNTSQNNNNTNKYSTLRFGDSGNSVKKLQQALVALGHNTNGVDGKYGNGTKNAVTAFQKSNGLKVDGIAGNDTQILLFEGNPNGTGSSNSNDNTGTTSYSTLRFGDKGEAVKKLQQALTALNYNTNGVDGIYGSGTRTAVRAFQKANKLTVDGIAGSKTLSKLYGGDGNSSPSGGNGNASAPNKSQIQLLHWFNDIKPTIRSGQTYYVYHPASKLGWNMRFYSLGRHADSEPLTAEDTATMNKAFGKVSWDPKAVYVKLPTGKWTIASMHNTPHLSGSIKDNDFDGHLCVHFLRDMSETERNDPNYGVQNQNVIRATWKSLTGKTYVEKY